MVIKSRALLPRPAERSDDEEEDPDELTARLRAYRRFREVASELGERERRGLRAYARATPVAPPDLPPRLEPSAVSPEDLARAFRAALAAVVEEKSPTDGQAVRPHVVRIRDRLAAIRSALEVHGRVSFYDVLTGDVRTREFVIVSFLAVLELLRRGAVRVMQDDLFGAIYLEAAEAMTAGIEDEPTFFDEPPS
jgi:segregation and condensation protein A